MEKYNKNIADNPKVAFIHVSLDSEKGDAEDWAKKEKFPWFTVLPERVKRSKLRTYKTTRSVPEYHLVAADGTSVAKGSSNIFKKIASLSESSSSQ